MTLPRRELPTPVTVEEAMRDAEFDVTVPDGMVMAAGPFEAEYADAFRLAEVTAFADLQRLGFIPDLVDENSLVEAVRADERVFRGLLHRRGTADPDPSCACAAGHADGAPTLARRHVQDRLVDLLQPLHRDVLRADDPAVLHAYHHARAWMARPNRYLVGIYALNDINIGDRATLTMTPTVQALHARDITIGDEGRLRFTGGGVHVRCRTLNGPSRFASGNLDKYVRNLGREERR
jgi:hypothetical protein